MELSFLQSVLIIVGLCLVIGIPLLMYLNGNFSYTDHIHSRRNYEVTSENMLGQKRVDHIQRVVIERHWHSGKIEYITKEVKI